MVDESNQLAQVGGAAEIDDVLQRRVRVAALAHLHEQDPVLEMIDNALKAFVFPPLDREVELAAGDDDPERHRRADDFLDREYQVFSTGAMWTSPRNNVGWMATPSCWFRSWMKP